MDPNLEQWRGGWGRLQFCFAAPPGFPPSVISFLFKITQIVIKRNNYLFFKFMFASCLTQAFLSTDSIFLIDIIFPFCSTPGGNTISAAEQTCVLISSLARYDGCSQVVRLCRDSFKFLNMQGFFKSHSDYFDISYFQSVSCPIARVKFQRLQDKRELIIKLFTL